MFLAFIAIPFISFLQNLGLAELFKTVSKLAIFGLNLSMGSRKGSYLNGIEFEVFYFEIFY
jgi:hypothetical protein